jgi:hypothetical protein
MGIFSVFFPSVADQPALDPRPIQSLHTMGRCLCMAADTTNTEYVSTNRCVTRGARMSVAAFLALRLLGLLVVRWQVICIHV